MTLLLERRLSTCLYGKNLSVKVRAYDAVVYWSYKQLAR